MKWSVFIIQNLFDLQWAHKLGAICTHKFEWAMLTSQFNFHHMDADGWCRKMTKIQHICVSGSGSHWISFSKLLLMISVFKLNRCASIVLRIKMAAINNQHFFFPIIVVWWGKDGRVSQSVHRKYPINYCIDCYDIHNRHMWSPEDKPQWLLGPMSFFASSRRGLTFVVVNEMSGRLLDCKSWSPQKTMS